MVEKKRGQFIKMCSTRGIYRLRPAAVVLIAALAVQACNTATGRPASDNGATAMSAEQMTALMREMSFRMIELSDQMAEQNASAERQQAMLLEMTETAAVLKRMAISTSAADVNMQLRIEHMRRRVDEMIRQMPVVHASQ